MLPVPPPADVDVFGRVTSVKGNRYHKRLNEMPVHPSLEQKPSWDSTCHITQHDRVELTQRLDKQATRTSRTAAGRMLAGYIDPVQRERVFTA